MSVSTRAYHVIILGTLIFLFDGCRPTPPPPGTTFRDCARCPEMIVIPTGSFVMGSPKSEAGRYDNEGPQHIVRIQYPFAVSKYEVTRGQFGAYARETGNSAWGTNCFYWNGEEGDIKNDDPNVNWQNPGFSQEDNHPVVCVSWVDARAYARWVSRITGKDYRLLSEAEWEYASRAGTTSARPWDENPDQACSHANIVDLSFERVVPPGRGKEWKSNASKCDDRNAYTAPVGTFRPNGFGLYDTIGNVWEWTEDCLNDSYIGAPDDGSAWLTGNCGVHITRGGGWPANSNVSRFAQRLPAPMGIRSKDLGFRLVRIL
jgi:formylglycine-generating enzyme required for sulfatase activity